MTTSQKRKRRPNFAVKIVKKKVAGRATRTFGMMLFVIRVFDPEKNVVRAPQSTGLISLKDSSQEIFVLLDCTRDDLLPVYDR